MTDPRITTIIPSYNHAPFVAQAIDSVLAQNYSNHECIVVDDASQDGSQRIIQNYADHPLVKVVLNENNRGQSAVIRQALTLSSAEFVALLPSDDWLLPERNRLQVNKFAEAGPSCGIVYGKGQRYYQDIGEIQDVPFVGIRGNVFEHLLLKEEVIYPVTPLIRRECYDEYPSNVSVAAEGEALWTKMSRTWKVDFVDSVVGVMRQHGTNAGRNFRRNYIDNVNYWEHYFDEELVGAEALKFRRRKLYNIGRMFGLIFLRDVGDAKLAKKALGYAIRQRPTALLTDLKLTAGYAMSLLNLSRHNPDHRSHHAQDSGS